MYASGFQMEDVYEECYEEDYKHRRIIKSKGYLFPKKRRLLDQVGRVRLYNQL